MRPAMKRITVKQDRYDQLKQIADKNGEAITLLIDRLFGDFIEQQDSMSIEHFNIQNAREAMKEAYDWVKNDRTYIRIYEVREALKWTKQKFNKTLESLARDYAIQLHYGDPGLLTTEQKEQSYIDNDGGLCITMTWRLNELL